MVAHREGTQMLCTDSHKDFITHVAFDFYGRRIATSSSDMFVCVWDASQDGKDWTRTAFWKSNCGPVWKVRWAHPEFGQILATCSFDRTVQIYEETGNKKASRLARAGIQVGRGEASNNWVKRSTLNESAVNVTDIQFAPRYMGLMLATGAKDGMVRIYEAPDIMNITQWECIHEIDFFREALITAFPELRHHPVKEVSNGKEQSKEEPQFPDIRISALSWSTCRFQRQLLAASTDSEDERANACRVVFFECVEERKCYEWMSELTIRENDPITDIAFAPSSGRTFHQFAVAIRDQAFIHHINALEIQEVVESDKAVTIGTVRRKPAYVQKVVYKVNLVAGINANKVRIWRLSWNVTGSVLSLGGSDGSVHIWKRFPPNIFKQIGYREPQYSSKHKRGATSNGQPFY
ncbi:hypothetical protein QR680_003560 [Steinernema hermaphroditum]|uniref:Uncharacterized protein n=1 Tax=Steinernema hermaphroditum TaxID=289476 RepID=A0AA39HN21_9BILA|nr:hypothetical protein QR680_003560 [Steinernema hermaphroditum]